MFKDIGLSVDNIQIEFKYKIDNNLFFGVE